MEPDLGKGSGCLPGSSRDHKGWVTDRRYEYGILDRVLDFPGPACRRHGVDVLLIRAEIGPDHLQVLDWPEKVASGISVLDHLIERRALIVTLGTTGRPTKHVR